VVVAQNPHEMIIILAVSYAASGPLGWLFRRFSKPAMAGVQPEGESQGKKALAPKEAKAKAKQQTDA
jgi:hypothetical protein